MCYLKSSRKGVSKLKVMKLYDKLINHFSVVAFVMLMVLVGSSIVSTQEAKVFIQIAGIVVGIVTSIILLVLAYIYLPYWFSKAEDCFFSFCENHLSGLTDKVDNLIAATIGSRIGVIVLDIATIICVSAYLISLYLGKSVEVSQVLLSICLIIQLVDRTYYRVRVR